MPEWNVMCSETVYFTVAVTAPDADEARGPFACDLGVGSPVPGLILLSSLLLRGAAA